jgi:hypothetical protein
MKSATNYTKYPRPLLWLVREGKHQTVDGPIEIESFYLSKSPVSNLQFEAYSLDHQRPAPRDSDNDPVTGVTLDEARGYCDWYAAISRKPMRLPTPAELEYARSGSAEFGLYGFGREGIVEWAFGDGGVGVQSFDSKQALAASDSRLTATGFRLARSFRI